jgi:decaprenyl-phosphate phosphoribosyltransferase
VSRVEDRAGEADLPDRSQNGASTAAALLRTARVKQWSKNVLVFAAPAAAGVLTHGHALWRALAAFALFCALASGVYFLNDAIDADADRLHPTKRTRPVAAGIISRQLAFASAAALIAVSVGLGALVTDRLALVLGVYTAVQVAYSIFLKHEPIFDLASVAGGFVLRAIAGAVAIPVPVSQWFLIVASFGSLLMVTGKRVAEQAELGDGMGSHRATLDEYSDGFLRTVLAIAAGGAIIGYCLWAFDLQTSTLHHHHDPIWFQLSIVPMITALLRYAFMVEAGRGARPEDLVLGDRTMQALGLAWVVLFAVGVYAG